MPEEIDLRAGLKIIKRRRKTIFWGTLVCVGLSVVTAFVLPKGYQSSLMLEVGRLYLSSDQWNQEMQYLEDPKATAAIIGSEGIVDQVRHRLNLDIKLKMMQKRLEVETFVENNEYSPILKVVYEGRTSRQAVDVLNLLADSIIKRHAKKYGHYRKALEGRIKYTRDKIAALDKMITARRQWMSLSQEYIDRGGGDIDEFRKDMSELGSTDISAVEILFLQSSTLTAKENIIELTRFKASMDMAISENQKGIADAGMEIVDLQSRLDLSSPTAIRSPAVISEYHSKPNKMLIIVIGGVLGLTLSSLAVFLQEYLRT